VVTACHERLWLWLPNGEAANTYFVVFGFTQPGLEPTIYRIYPTGPRTHDLPDLPNRASNPRSTGFTQPGIEPTIYRIYPTGHRTHDLSDLPNRASNPRSTALGGEHVNHYTCNAVFTGSKGEYLYTCIYV
jgi:hypothetical protein